MILEGRSGKESPRIKNGSDCLKLTDKMEAEKRRGGEAERRSGSPWLTSVQGAVSAGSLSQGEPGGGSLVTERNEQTGKHQSGYRDIHLHARG